MDNNNTATSLEQQFGEVIDIILRHKSRASRAVNNELLLTAWHAGRYVSAKLKAKNEEARSWHNYPNISAPNDRISKVLDEVAFTTWSCFTTNTRRTHFRQQ